MISEYAFLTEKRSRAFDAERPKLIGIGSSDAAAAVDHPDAFQTALDLYLDLRAKLAGSFQPRPVEPYMEWGIIHEPTILSEFAQRQERFVLGRDRRMEPVLYCPSGLVLPMDTPFFRELVPMEALALLERVVWKDGPFPAFCHLDGIVLEAWANNADGRGGFALRLEGPIECKTYSAYAGRAWGETGTDEIPKPYLLQITHALLCLGSHGFEFPMFVAGLGGGNRWTTYTVPLDLDLAATYTELATDFWNEHVVPGDPPPAQRNERGIEALKRLFPEESEDERMAGEEDMGALYRLAYAASAAKSAEAELAAAKVWVMERMGDVGKLTISPGIHVLWKRQRGTPNWKAIAEALAGDIANDLIEKYRGEPTRVFRADALKKLEPAIGLPDGAVS